MELLAAMAVTALLLPLMSTAIYQISRDSDRNNTLITSLTQIEDGARLLSKDIRKAQHTDLTAGGEVTSMFLEWTDWSDPANLDTYDSTAQTTRRVRATWQEDIGEFGFLNRTRSTCSDYDLVANDCGYFDGTSTWVPVPWVNDPTTVDVPDLLSARFSLDASGYITGTFTSSADNSRWPNQARTYELKEYASLLGSDTPIR